MIPKIIHYCWLSDDPMPEFVLKCISNWKDNLPDYKFMLWDKKQFDINSIPWVKQAYDVKKYAFAADYIRLYAVYKYGGIYLDTDVEILKPFDSLLHLPYFVGLEFNNRLIEAATFGGISGQKWMADVLEYYSNRNFILPNGNYDMKVLPLILKELIIQNYKKFEINESIPVKYKNENIFYLFTSDFFSPKSCYSRKISCSKNTFSIHHFNATWMSPSFRLFMYIKHIIYKIYMLFRLYKIIPLHKI